MSNSISTLLLRNLSDVFGENDPVRRRAAINEIFHEDAVFYDPKGGVIRGRDEIDRNSQRDKSKTSRFRISARLPSRGKRGCRTSSMGIWHFRQTTSLRGNRFYRRSESSHCLGLSIFRRSSLRQSARDTMTDPSNALQSIQEALLHGGIQLRRGVLDRDLYAHFDRPNG